MPKSKKFVSRRMRNGFDFRLKDGGLRSTPGKLVEKQKISIEFEYPRRSLEILFPTDAPGPETVEHDNSDVDLGIAFQGASSDSP